MKAAALRLDGAIRALLAEQGTKRVPKDVLAAVVGGTLRLRLTAESLAATPAPGRPVDDADARAEMADAVRLAGEYDRLASRLGPMPMTVAEELTHVRLQPAATPSEPRARWAEEHLRHLRRNVEDLADAAAVVAAAEARPWWR